MLETRIKLAEMDAEKVADEIGEFVVNTVVGMGKSGCVMGISGGVDSTTTAALINRAFDRYNAGERYFAKEFLGPGVPEKLELVGYMLPSSVNNPADKDDGVKVAERLGIRYEVLSINKIVEAYSTTNPEVFSEEYHAGNLMSRIRANILSTKSASESKVLSGTGNKDEDFGIGYYTLFGDGAVHMNPIGGLSKRLVRQMARHLGFEDLADREPTAGLEPGQTDFKDLGYSYDVVELVTEGFEQGFNPVQMDTHPQVVPLIRNELKQYREMYGTSKFGSVQEVIMDITRRHNTAGAKAGLIHPPTAQVTLNYR